MSYRMPHRSADIILVERQVSGKFLLSYSATYMDIYTSRHHHICNLPDLSPVADPPRCPHQPCRGAEEGEAGEGNTNEYVEMTYEGYGPAGVAVMVETLSDNKNRIAGDLRHYFDKYGGNLGQTGCVGFMFDHKGVILIEKKDGMDEDEVMMDALDCGAEDFSAEDGAFEITTSPEDFSSVREALEGKGYEFAQAEIQYVPKTLTVLTSEEDIKNMEKLIDMLEDNDDVQNIYHTWDMPEEDEEE